MAYWAGVLGVAVLIAGAGTYVGTSTYSGGQKAKHQKGVQKDKEAEAKRLQDKLMTGAESPDPNDAKRKAKKKEDKRRRMIALAGGKTILSSEGSPTESETKTLLGS